LTSPAAIPRRRYSGRNRPNPTTAPASHAAAPAGMPRNQHWTNSAPARPAATRTLGMRRHWMSVLAAAITRAITQGTMGGDTYAVVNIATPRWYGQRTVKASDVTDASTGAVRSVSTFSRQSRRDADLPAECGEQRSKVCSDGRHRHDDDP